MRFKGFVRWALRTLAWVCAYIIAIALVLCIFVFTSLHLVAGR